MDKREAGGDWATSVRLRAGLYFIISVIRVLAAEEECQ